MTETLSATRHVITATIPVQFTFPGMAEGEREVANVKVEVTYSAAWGYVREPDGTALELTLIDAKLLDGDGLDLDDKDVRERAQDWLDDEGYDAACQHAEARAS